MILKELYLKNFRNLSRIEVYCENPINVIWGDNAQGKTNILESIYLLSNLKSFRQSKNIELIKFNESESLISGSVDDKGLVNKLKVNLFSNKRRQILNNCKVEDLTQYLGVLRAVLFTPEEIFTLRGYPVGRRALIDRAVLQTEVIYLKYYQSYLKILKHRNYLLKNKTYTDQILVWNKTLAANGAKIRKYRQNFIERINPILKTVYKSICYDQEDINIKYSIDFKSENELANELIEDLNKNIKKDFSTGITASGPHRDEVFIEINDKPLKFFGSQGQQRSFLLAFKAAQIIDQEKLFGTSPILLLDDLSSELDDCRQSNFLNFLIKQNCQVFLTTVQPKKFIQFIDDKADYFSIKNGFLSKNKKFF